MSHTHDHGHDKAKGLSLAFWLNLLFSVIEIVGGALTNSTAIIADAWHDFTDAVAIGLAVLLEKISGKPSSHRFSYGYRRFSLLSALGMSLFLLVGAVFMAISAYRSFLEPQVVNSTGMLWLAVLGIAINGLAFVRIKQSNGHTHDHGHGHAHAHHHNSKAIMLHLLEDVLGWAAVLVCAIVISFTGWYWVDGVLALGIAVFIGYNASRNLVATMTTLLQSVPGNVDLEKLSVALQQVGGVEEVHDLHVWSLDGSYHVGSLHAVVRAGSQAEEASVFSALTALMQQYHIQRPTIQLETAATRCRPVMAA